MGLVAWLCIGSVPAAFAGVLVTRALGTGDDVQHIVKTALGVALLVAAAGLTVRAYLRLAEQARRRDGRAAPLPQDAPSVRVHRADRRHRGRRRPRRRDDVGRVRVAHHHRADDAVPAPQGQPARRHRPVQAVPLVTSAALGHVLFGDFQLSVTTSLLIGSVPGAWVGAQLSARAPGGLVRRCLAFVLLASALKLLDVSTPLTGAVLVVALLVAPVLWMLVRRHFGFPALARRTAGTTAGAGWSSGATTSQ